MSSQPSFYIPSVYANITQEMVKQTFKRMNIGEVTHVEFVEQNRRDGKRGHKKAYVYFDRLYDQAGAMPILAEIHRDGMSRVHYSHSQHVYWVLLENTRKPTPAPHTEVVEACDSDEVSVESAPNSSQHILYTEEEAAFVPEEDFSMVDADYAAILESEIAKLRNENEQLRMNAQVTFAHYNHALASYHQLFDQQHKWRELIMNNQMDRLRNIVLRGENVCVCPGANGIGCGSKLSAGEEYCGECTSVENNGQTVSSA